MIIGTFAARAAAARAMSPRYAYNAAMPSGAMPNGTAYEWPNSSVAGERFDTSTRTRGRNPSSENASRLSLSDQSVSAAPAT